MTRKAYAECSAHNHVSICTEKRGVSQYMKKVLLGLFFLYCLLLAEILFLSRVAVREITVAEYFRTYANVCPFKTIVRYTVHVMTRKDLASLRLAISNIGGNFVLFMPMGIFLPVLFKGLNRFRRAFFCDPPFGFSDRILSRNFPCRHSRYRRSCRQYDGRLRWDFAWKKFRRVRS